MVNGKFPYYIWWKTVLDITGNFTVVYRFWKWKKNIIYTEIVIEIEIYSKLTFLEVPALHFKFDVCFFLEITFFIFFLSVVYIRVAYYI